VQFQNIISENQVRAFKAPTGKYVIKISCCHCSCQLKHQIGRPSKLFTVIVVFLSYRCLYYKISQKTIGWAPALLTNIRLGRNYLLVGQSSLFCQSINVEISQNIFHENSMNLFRRTTGGWRSTSRSRSSPPWRRSTGTPTTASLRQGPPGSR
jgi:hypothetical protein